MTSTRIPEALQSVFLASNRGEEVNVAPPNNLAAKLFGRFTKSFRRPSFLGRKIASTNSSTSAISSGAHTGFPSLCRSPKSSTSQVSRGEASRRRPDQPPDSRYAHHLREQSSPNRQTSARSPKRSPSGKQQSKAIPRTTLSRPPSLPTISPQDYLDALMKNRGYDIVHHHTLCTGFHKTNTEIQIASYQPHVIGLALKNPSGLRAVLCAGLSPNPCNMHGESLLHSVCRKRNLPALQVLVERGSDLHVCDDYGRTPLHDACWSNEPNFDVIDCLLTQDTDGPLYLFHLLDSHGGSPLSYVDKIIWHDWLCYLEARKDKFWPLFKVPQEPTKLCTTLMAKPKTLEVAQPFAVLPLQIAVDVARGRLAPSEAMLFVELSEDSSCSSWSDSSGASSSDDDFSMDDEKDDENKCTGMQSSVTSVDHWKLLDGQCSTTTSKDTRSSEDEESFLCRQSSWGGLSLMASNSISIRDLQTSWGEATLGA